MKKIRLKSVWRHFWRGIAIRVGAYPKFITKKYFNIVCVRTFRKYYPIVVDCVSKSAAIIDILGRNGASRINPEVYTEKPKEAGERIVK